jgi:DNA-binding transcriptional LysR family regulator
MSVIENRLLRYFVAVAEEQHFGRAAERLGITPPTLTHQIQKLESELGARLLRRRGHTKVVVTAAGQRVLAHAREVLRQVEEIPIIAQRAERGELGSLQVGFMGSVSGAGLLRDWIRPFEQANPSIEVTVRKLSPVAQITAILSKEVDVGFARGPHKYPPGVRGFEIARQNMMLALPSEHLLVGQKKITPAMLAGEAFVSTPPELELGFFGYIETVARIGKFVPRVVHRDSDYTALLAYVALGHGIAVVPESVTKAMTVADVTFCKIAADPVPQTSICFIYGTSASPSTRLLIQHMQRFSLRDPGGAGTPPRGAPRAIQKCLPRLAFSRMAS